MSLLKQEYKEEETSLEEALALSVKVLSKTLDVTKLTPDKGRVAVVMMGVILRMMRSWPADKGIHTRSRIMGFVVFIMMW